MGGFFDFIGDLEFYAGHDQPVRRMNKRHRFLIEPFADEIRGARVLDLASHDGRWCYAFAGAGAASVEGIEGRAELVEQFAHYPDPELRGRVTLRVGDLYDGMEEDIRAGKTYDVVGCFGILYHVMDHFRMFQLIARLRPRLVIVDSEFMLRPGPVIQLIRERTDNVLNAIPQHEGQEVAVKGVPSFSAMELIAEANRFSCDWMDWGALPPEDRKGVADYYRPEKMRRATCALRPLG